MSKICDPSTIKIGSNGLGILESSLKREHEIDQNLLIVGEKIYELYKKFGIVNELQPIAVEGDEIEGWVANLTRRQQVNIEYSRYLINLVQKLNEKL